MRRTLAPAAALLLAAPAAGQVAAPVPAVPTASPAGWVLSVAPLTATTNRAAPTPAPAAPAEAKPAEPAKVTDSPRLTKLKSITYDRRPSAVLRAWAPPPAKPGAEKPAELDAEAADLQKAVALGEWAKVKAYLAGLPDEEATAAYAQMLQSLSSPPSGQSGVDPDRAGGIPPQLLMQMVPGAQQQAERHRFGVDDLLGLAAAAPAGANVKLLPERAALIGGAGVAARAPAGLTKEQVPQLASVLREVVAGGTLPEVADARLRAEVAKPSAPLTKRQAAKIVVGAGFASFAGEYLPTPDQATKEGDLEGLNLLSQHYLALSAEPKAGGLEKAWASAQAVLATPGGDPAAQQEALLRAVQLAPRLKEKFGEQWLDESFTKDPPRGMAILATAGTIVAQGLPTKPFQPDERLNALKLVKTAVDALLKASPAKATEWRGTLTLLAAGWLKEAEFSRMYDTSDGSGPRLRRDVYGNIYYANPSSDDDAPRVSFNQRPDMPRPIALGEVMRARPGDAWVLAVDESFRPRLAGLLARLHLKAGEEEKAFPLIEQLAAAQPKEARNLAREFLRVWTRNHDPNVSKNENRYSWFFYAFEQRAEGIPLTRSKQERNLAELSGWAARLRRLPGAADVDDEMLAKAFTACHSSAEVYRTPAIESVFGPVAGIKPRTLAALAQQMRGNLAGLWRDPQEQIQKKTNRRKKDIEQEVLRGYAVARATVDDGLRKFPDSWALLAAAAGLMHDEVNYRQELNKTPDFAAKRSEALATYKLAAEKYAADLKGLPEDEQTNAVYEQWFAASLGAVDLGMITEEKLPDWRQPALIRAALLALPGELGTKHLDRFANGLFTRLSGAKPHVKYNYLKAGFEVVGDHKQAAEAKKLCDYYKDLVTEIKLEAKVDGSAEVGHGRPFGVFVNLRHTRDIEREGGGFSRYLQNQNSMFYSYNYGRPTTDYRDRFEKTAREALREQFDVVSVTFQDEKVTSRALPEFGWRYTPYAYLLLKPKGPEVDRLPPLRLDLDFLDTSGYVVLPVETPAVVLDCKAKAGEPRPITNLSVTQTLDERQADKGTLILEVRATGAGLVPELADLCDLKPDGFDVAKVEDQGVAVKKFDEAAENAVLSERSWSVTLIGKEGLTERPKEFRFASLKLPTKESIFQRYVDADLSPVGESVALEAKYGTKSWLDTRRLAPLGVALGVLVMVFGAWSLRRAKPPAEAAPEGAAGPFAVLELLRGVRERAALSPERAAELDRDIGAVERHFFAADPGGAAPDLAAIRARWR